MNFDKIIVVMADGYSSHHQIANCMLQGHSKIVQHCNMNSGAPASEDSSELAAQQN
jgi:hypothetical protein